MIDNGLLKYYPFSATRDGFLKMRDIRYKFLESSAFNSAHKYSYDEGKFYFKKEGSDEIDSQVLLSQIYKKVGLNSAIYLPGLSPQNYRGTISNDISSSSNINGKDFFSKLYEIYPKEVIDAELIKHTKSIAPNLESALKSDSKLRSNVMFISKNVYKNTLAQYENLENNPFDFVEFFTKDGMRDFIKMHLFDTASGNIDRNASNFYFELNDQGKICGVTTIDHSVSQDSILFDHPDASIYFNFLGEPCETNRSGMIYELKENETVQDFLPASEMAEMVGNVDVVETAKDIKRETGYSIDPEYIDELSISYERLANELAK